MVFAGRRCRLDEPEIVGFVFGPKQEGREAWQPVLHAAASGAEQQKRHQSSEFREHGSYSIVCCKQNETEIRRLFGGIPGSEQKHYLLLMR